MSQKFLVETVINQRLDFENIKTALEEFYETDEEQIVFKVRELTDDDFDGEPNTTTKHVNGPLKLNLRRFKETKINNGDLCTVIGLDNSPKMLVEHISNADDPNDSSITYPSALCCWFSDNKTLSRMVFKIEHLKKCEKEELKELGKLPDSNMYGYRLNIIAKNSPTFREYIYSNQKLNAIKQYRTLTHLGLKEAKDSVESITPLMIENWKVGVFE